MSHDDTLTFRDTAVQPDETAVLPHRVDLKEGELVLTGGGQSSIHFVGQEEGIDTG